MKYVFEKHNNEAGYESGLTVRKLESSLLLKRREKGAQTEALLRIAPWKQAVFSIPCFIGLLCLSIFFELWKDVTFAEMVESNFHWLLIVGVPLAVIGGGIMAFYIIRNRRILASPAFTYAEEQQHKVDRECSEALGISETAAKLDVLSAVYKMKKNGTEKLCAVRENLFCPTYREDDALFISNYEIVVRIPFSEITRFEWVRKRITFNGWNQEGARGRGMFGKFRGYRIRVDDWGNYSVKPYLALTLHHSGEEYELAFPPYEEETLVRLLGRTAQ